MPLARIFTRQCQKLCEGVGRQDLRGRHHKSLVGNQRRRCQILLRVKRQLAEQILCGGMHADAAGGLHHPAPPVRATVGAWAKSLLGRYVPGNLLMVVGRAVMAQAHGVPRLVTPRAKVQPGSVALSGRQCVIYNAPSPGGWQIIGRTPAVMFDLATPPHVVYRAGDQLRCVPIEAADWDAWCVPPRLVLQ